MTTEAKPTSAPVTKKTFVIGAFVVLMSIVFFFGGQYGVSSAENRIALNQYVAKTSGNLRPGLRTEPLQDSEKIKPFIGGGFTAMFFGCLLIAAMFGAPLVAVSALYDYLWNREKFNKDWRSTSKPREVATTDRSYGPDWDDLARSVRRRDAYKCRMCGAGNVELHVHHLIARAKGGPDAPENLVTLCKNCHENLHPHMQGR